MSANCYSPSVGNRELVFPINTNYVHDDLKERAKTELSEDEQTRSKTLELLRCMLRNEAEFSWQDDDLFLLAYLRARKFNIERAFSLMKTFYTVVDKYDELYNNFNINLVKKTLQQVNIGFLPYKDSEGCVILVYQVAPWDPYENNLGDIMRAISTLFLLSVQSPATQIAGIKVIVDFSGFSLSHVPHVSPSYLWLAAEALQNCFPARFPAIHVVNESILFASVWAVLKNVLSKKIRKRWHFHGNNVKNLHKYFPPSILPLEYEGELSPFENSSSLKEVEECATYMNYVFSFGFQNKFTAKRKYSSGNSMHLLRRLSQTLSPERRKSSQTEDTLSQDGCILDKRKTSSENTEQNGHILSQGLPDDRSNSNQLGRRLSQGFSNLRKNSTDGLVQMQRRLYQCFSHS